MDKQELRAGDRREEGGRRPGLAYLPSELVATLGALELSHAFVPSDVHS